MTPYETLREIRNKRFPPKLEFGCEYIAVLPTNETENKQQPIYIPCYRDSYTILRNNNEIIETGSDYEPKFWNKKHGHYIGKILGKEVTLQEILLMLDDEELHSNPPRTPYISANGRLYRGYPSMTDHIQLDLTKSIQDQTPEVLSAIIKLIQD